MCAIHKERNGLLCLRTPVPINVLRTTAVGVLALSALGHHAHGLRSPLPRGEAGGWRRGRATWIGGVTSGPAPLSVSLSLLRPPPPHSPPSAIPLPLPRPTPPPARATDPSCSSPCRGPRLRARHCRCFLPVRHCRCFPLPFPLPRPPPPPPAEPPWRQQRPSASPAAPSRPSSLTWTAPSWTWTAFTCVWRGGRGPLWGGGGGEGEGGEREGGGGGRGERRGGGFGDAPPRSALGGGGAHCRSPKGSRTPSHIWRLPLPLDPPAWARATCLGPHRRLPCPRQAPTIVGGRMTVGA